MRRREFLAGLLSSSALPAYAQFAIFQAALPGGTGGFGSPHLQVQGMFATTNGTVTFDQAQTIYTPGNEGPAISTADYYHSGALLFMRPYDLDTMGAPGATVKSNNGGNRYVWLASFDHPGGGVSIHTDSWGLLIGFSSDPGIFPSVMVNAIPPMGSFLGDATTPGLNGLVALWDFAPSSLVYNPDDASFPFYLYTQGTNPPTFGVQSISWKSTNLFDWVGNAWGPADIDQNFDEITSFQFVNRLGVNNWQAFGVIGTLGRTGMGIWNSTDGKTFTYTGSSTYNETGFPSVNFSIDYTSGTPNRLTASSAIFSSADNGKNVTLYSNPGGGSALAFNTITYVSPTQIDLSSVYPTGADFAGFPPYGNNNSNYYFYQFTNSPVPFEKGPFSYRVGPSPVVVVQPALSVYGSGGGACANPTFSSGGQLYQPCWEDARHINQPFNDGLYATLSPVDSNFNISQSVAAIRVSSNYDGPYAGPRYLQYVASYNEDGICHIYNEVGYPGPHATGQAPFVGARALGSLSGSTFTISSLVNGAGFVPLGSFVGIDTGVPVTVGTVSSGGPGTTGTYTITNSSGIAVPLTIGSQGAGLGFGMFVGSQVVTASISGTTLTVATTTGTINNGDTVKFALVLGQISAFVSGVNGGAGVYTIDNYGVVVPSGTSFVINDGAVEAGAGKIDYGYFGHQFIDYYTIAYDSVSASDAAPFGAAASCNNNTVTISWRSTPLGTGAKSQSYNVYRGTTSGSQTTLVGNTSSLSMTDTPTPGSQYWYKVVKVSGGVETKSRVVNTYVG